MIKTKEKKGKRGRKQVSKNIKGPSRKREKKKQFKNLG